MAIVNAFIQTTLAEFGLTNQTCTVAPMTCAQLCAASGVSASIALLAASTVLAMASVW